MNELVKCVRHGDLPGVTRVLPLKETDVNARCPVTVWVLPPAGTPTPYEPHTSEGPLYTTHALFEASRGGHQGILDALLSCEDLDVNQPATLASITTLADAAARGDSVTVVKLLNDPRIATTSGSKEVRTPLLYATKYGHVDIVKLFLARSLASLEEEEELKTMADSNGNGELVALYREYFLTTRTLEDMSPSEKVDRIRLEFQRADTNNNGSLDQAELMTLARALGVPLLDDEADEALIAMDTDHDGRVEVGEVIAFWLGERLSL